MIIIVNELSLTGQFPDINSFLNSIRPFLIILNTLSKLELEILKNYSFFSLNITATHRLTDLLRDINLGREEEVRGLRNQLVKFTNTPPYWEDQQKHTCENVYTCNYTSLTCNYGLAEAVEYDLLVISFSHDSFTSNILDINKNNKKFELQNFNDVEAFGKWLVSQIQINKLSFSRTDKLFPEIQNSINLGYKKETYDYIKRLSSDERVSKFKDQGTAVAILNGWKLHRHISNKNDREVYFKEVYGKTQYLTIDTYHGTFEIFNHSGMHLGEYNFFDEKTEGSKGYTITL